MKKGILFCPHNIICTAPKMYIYEVEEESEILIDNNAHTCVNLTGNDGCKKDGVQSLFMMLYFPNLFVMHSINSE